MNSKFDERKAKFFNQRNKQEYVHKWATAANSQ